MIPELYKNKVVLNGQNIGKLSQISPIRALIIYILLMGVIN
jgi:hypothetical protein